LLGLRAAIIELLAAVEADPANPQGLARRFGLNKNLTWRISKVVGTADPYAAVPHIPGTGGFRILFDALARAGAPESLINDARRAAADFQGVVNVHTGDRTTLEMMVNDLLPDAARREQAEQVRKQAFRGNSGIWGVRAKAQMAMNILAPHAGEPDHADLVQVAGLVGFRRLRPDVRWLLFRKERWNDDDPQPDPDVIESLDPDFPAERGVPLLGEYCTRPVPDIRLIRGESEDQFELPPGPVGATAALTCIYGQVIRKVGATYAQREGEYSEIGCNLVTPAEQFVFDLLVHRDFEWAMPPELAMYGRLDGSAMHMAARRERNLLKVPESVQDLGLGVAALVTPLLPRYSNLVRDVFARLAWNADDFRAFRLSMPYPPVPTVALLRVRLPVRAADAG
jgi:hypothetical protein